MKKVTKRTGLILLGLLIIIGSTFQAQSQDNIYVSPKGNDKNPGTLNKPLFSLKEAVQLISNSSRTGSAIIFMREGIYPINETIIIDSAITSSRKITVTAYQKERVVISGGTQLNPKKFRPSSDERMNAKSSKSNGIYETNLEDQNLLDFGNMKPHGFGRIEVAAMEIFIDKTPLTLARWPNNGLLPIGDILEQGSIIRNGDRKNIGAKFKYNFDRPSQWKTTDDIWLYGIFANSYADDNIPVETINVTDKIIKLKQAAYYGVFSTFNSENSTKSYPYRGYYFYNVAEELDSVGEWYLDKKKKKLYVYPPAKISSATIIASKIETPLLFLHHAENLTFKNIEFGYGRGIGVYATGTKNVTFSECEFYDFGVQALNIGEPAADFRLLYKNVVISEDRSDNNNFNLSGCKIYNTGAGAVIVTGGDRKTLSAANNKIEDCEIFNYSRINRANPAAIQLSGVGNSISHCFIHDGPSGAIAYKGNNHTISYNHIRNVAFEFIDIGAVYTGRDPSSIGTRIQNNFFDSIEGINNSAVAAVYIDDGSGGINVTDNIFYTCGNSPTGGYGAVHINGGRDNSFKNNYFINCKKAFSNTVWDEKKWKAYMFKSEMLKKITEDVDIRSEIFLSSYPFLKTFFDTSSTKAVHQNYISNSLLLMYKNLYRKK